MTVASSAGEASRSPSVRRSPLAWIRARWRGRYRPSTEVQPGLPALPAPEYSPQTALQLLGLSSEARLFIQNITVLSSLTVEDVGVPRADIAALPIDSDRHTFLKLVEERGHSRFPVYDTSLDSICGMVHIRDLLPLLGSDTQFDLRSHLRDMSFISPSVPVLDLLVQMQAEQRHMALVVDEFGGIDRLVTIEDLIEQIVGDIHDEHDDATPEIEAQGAGRWVADARVGLSELEAMLGTFLESEEREEDVDTLGGLLYTQLGRIPSRGEVIRHPSGFQFHIQDADARRIRTVLISAAQQRLKPGQLSDARKVTEAEA